ncbi:hypothetical protein S83_056879 [Arachis hypogaea]
MRTPMDMINKINLEKETLSLKVRVIRLWTISNFSGQLFLNSTMLILIDESRCKIQVIVRRPVILSEGQVYVMKHFSYILIL